MFTFLLDVKVIALLISCVSLFISFFTLWINRKRLDVTIENLGLIDRVENFDKELVFPNQTTSVFIVVKIINMSPKDIGFFDISLYDGLTKDLLPGFYKYAIRPEFQSDQLLAINEMENTISHFNPLDSNYGLVPANSFKRFETLVHPATKTFIVDIKFAIKTLRKNPYASTRKYFKHYSKVITLSDEEWIAIQRSRKQVQESIEQ
ncbi:MULTISPECIES: hypothetical protein [unclassified Sporosarcina]|uniref:hypothetical protein n=1 Tax=unclassified Sporosarcina TaxID=2647733 RepID=UPI000C16459B|nr:MULTISPECIES: hypothetical protein [unclassified Sporosarcina]PID07137.1 hypothetical protein CSV66_00725 [Sporosarcina sp. P30]PID10333.1 hypothetical protein CSV65_00730 [Sporosarcina sp. P31]PID12917.1 hypothetical protein CSV64_03310 [Sporosarcina sp. P32b]